jgi:NAD(P)H-dependent FMN reductase
MSASQSLRLQVIIGTTRQNRFSEKVAWWIFEEVKKQEGIEVELLDLRDYPLPFFNEPVSPAIFEVMKHEYSNEVARAWTQKVAEADGYIIVTGEYNHGYPAVLKNALDYVFKEWNHKAVGFVSYGNAGGARAVEQLRQVVVELQMVPIRNAIHIPVEVYMAVMNEKVPVNTELFKPLRVGRVDRVEVFLNDLVWNARSLKTAREADKT